MSVPIAVAPARSSPQDYHLPSFASFQGSPISLKTGSFQNTFYPAGSPGHSLGPIAMPDLSHGPTAWLSAAAVADDLCRNYSCCGLALPDLHALVEHFESRHVEVIWPPVPTLSYPSPDATPAFDADDMDITTDSSPSPPATPAQSAFDSVRVCFSGSGSAAGATATTTTTSAAALTPSAPFTSSYSSLAGANGPAAAAAAAATNAFNPYARYADYSSGLPGTHPSPVYDPSIDKPTPSSMPQSSSPPLSTPPCVPPALLFSASTPPSPLNTPGSSRTSTPILPLHPLSTARASSSCSSSSSSSSLSLPPHTQPAKRAPSAPSTLCPASSKPFRCPKPGCNKAYKQQNGLKYHLSHGQCNFAPRDPTVDALSEAERERRLRPFVCAVGAAKECGRRYKNMNGLRYHYTHTGEHGARGLALLAQGQHPLPDLPPSSSTPSSSSSSPSLGPVPNNATVVASTSSTPATTPGSSLPSTPRSLYVPPVPVSLPLPPPVIPSAAFASF